MEIAVVDMKKIRVLVGHLDLDEKQEIRTWGMWTTRGRGDLVADWKGRERGRGKKLEL
jgi:hypothetical protein